GDDGVQARRARGRSARDVPRRLRDDPGQPRRAPRALAARRSRRGAAGRSASHCTGPGRRPDVLLRRRDRSANQCRWRPDPGIRACPQGGEMTAVDFDDAIKRYDPVLWIEVHVALGTKPKIFDDAPAHLDGEPNVAINPTTLGLPGSLPVVNKKA